ncbi:MAG: 3-methyl-2-oxobutanoate hydroxymethyltransferase [Phycisphaerae bacterium]|jgi:3-methyl-2-oxobutanoate hydroxymethyltransferase
MDKFSVSDMYRRASRGEKFSMITCYDYTMARILARTEIDSLLVGDSAAQMMLGARNTLGITMDILLALTCAVRRGAPEKMVIADMPFMSYQPSLRTAMQNAGRFVSEADADVVKVEAGRAQLDTIKAIADCGISVMAHIGLRPQAIGLKGVLKAEGTNAAKGYELIKLAEDMERAGAGSILIEGACCEVVDIICENVTVPTVSCGAGAACDGQVLVINDVLSLHDSYMPKFARRYTNISESIEKAISQYHQDVLSGGYPSDEESYHIRAGELEILKRMMTN